MSSTRIKIVETSILLFNNKGLANVRLQDIAEYCEYIFLSDEGGDDRVQVLEHLKPNFLPNGTIERAYHADKMRSIS